MNRLVNAKTVRGPDGSLLSKRDLPPSGTVRWVIKRKAIVVLAVEGGIVTLEEVCKLYTLSMDEFLSWQRLVSTHGLPGLRTTRTQQYRGKVAA